MERRTERLNKGGRDKIIHLLRRVFFLPPVVVLLLIPVASMLLVLAFSEPFQDTPLAYFGYFASAYTLTVTVCGFPRIIQMLKNGFWSLPVVKKFDNSHWGHQFLRDTAFRGTVSIYQGLVVSAFYVLFRGITACLYHSVWFAAIAGYYFFLCVVRLMLAHYVRQSNQCADDVGRARVEYRAYLLCGCLMLLLNGGMAGVITLMVRDNLHYDYPGYVIYLSAMYTFYTAISASCNVVKFRRLRSPILSASKAISFTGAMMSVMALQTAMIARFGEEDAVFRQTANTITGAVVCVFAVVISIYMIIRGAKKYTLGDEEERGFFEKKPGKKL